MHGLLAAFILTRRQHGELAVRYSRDGSRDDEGAVVDDLDAVGGEVVGPRADIARRVGGDIVEPNLQQDAVLEAVN